MKTDTQTRLIPTANSAAIRCYGQGLGDCFLLAFPRTDDLENPFYVVIDCGVAKGTPGEQDRMRTVVEDIQAATSGHLDILAITHQHYDHVSGFAHAEDIWRTFTVDRLYLPWTENPNDADAATISKAALRLSQAADEVAERAARLAVTPSQTALQMPDGLLAAGNESFGVSAAQAIGQGWEVALALCPEDCRIYCEPGDVFELDGSGVKAYILGPPRLHDQDGQPLDDGNGKPLVFLLEDSREMYSYEQFRLAPDSPVRRSALHADVQHGGALALASALIGGGDGDFDRYCPFDPTMQISWTEATGLLFFRQHYASAYDWRRVDNDWLEGASDLALRAGGFTNNTSLVLAFELPRSKDILLFVGDAQVGNWLSWHDIRRWRPKDSSLPSTPADMDDLLGRVAFYKVGHHGSHNATIRDKGLEKMRDRLTAFIPISVPVAHDIMRYCPMPFYPVLLALQQKTGGRVFLANGRLLEPLPEGADRQQLEAKAVQSSNRLPEKVRNPDTAAAEKLEDAVPLWIQFTLDD